LPTDIDWNSSTREPIEKSYITLTVNGEPHRLGIGSQQDEIAPSHTLAYTLRESLGFTGTKIGCDHGACGACTVIMDGEAVQSCSILTIECDGKSILTIEGLEVNGQLHPLQQAFIDHTAFQCGFCTPGIIMSTKALLDANPSPTEDDIKQELAGHFCRCISHYLVIKAVMAAAGRER